SQGPQRGHLSMATPLSHNPNPSAPRCLHSGAPDLEAPGVSPQILTTNLVIRPCPASSKVRADSCSKVSRRLTTGEAPEPPEREESIVAMRREPPLRGDWKGRAFQHSRQRSRPLAEHIDRLEFNSIT